MQHAAVDEQERDQQPADASVAVHERMDRFELRVCDPDMYEHRQLPWVVEKTLEIVKCRLHFRNRRRDERRVANVACTGRPDEVLVTAELPRHLGGAPNTLHELGVDLADESLGERKAGQPLKAVVHRSDVVHDFVDVTGHVRYARFKLDRKEVLEGALGTFDLRAQHSSRLTYMA